MVPPSAQGKPGAITQRIVSAAIMLPLAAAAVWAGGWVFALLISVAAALMYMEWQALCGEKGKLAYGLAAMCGAATLVSVLPGPWAVVVAGVSIGIAVGTGGHRAFRVAGFAYIVLACISLVWLRRLDPSGLEAVVWLGAVVVMTDTCAYFTGKTVGGPKLAPKISPKKTWSGLLGGMAGAAAASGAVGVFTNSPYIIALVIIGAIFAAIAQLGDLLVSRAKRAFGVKDSGNLIPGHGGVLDRLDGFLSASLALAVLVLLGGGGPMAWQ